MTVEEDTLLSAFSKLTKPSFNITSSIDFNYNCIAWSVGDSNNIWWPIGHYWPQSVPREETVNAFIEAFKTLGFEECNSAVYEENVEKIALYLKDSKPTHASKLLPNGRWTSKLGGYEDIEHDLKSLDGDKYGKVEVFLKRMK